MRRGGSEDGSDAYDTCCAIDTETRQCLSGDGERWRALHVTLGYLLAGLLVFRVAYGLAGPRQVRLPPRVHHEDYVRHPVPAEMFVPERY